MPLYNILFQWYPLRQKFLPDFFDRFVCHKTDIKRTGLRMPGSWQELRWLGMYIDFAAAKIQVITAVTASDLQPQHFLIKF